MTEEWPVWSSPPKSTGILTMSLKETGSFLSISLYLVTWPALAVAASYLWVHFLWGQEELLYTANWTFKDIILGSDFRRWEAQGVFADGAPCFHGSTVMLHFLLLAGGAPCFHVFVLWGLFFFHWAWTTLMVLFLRPAEGHLQESCCGYRGRLHAGA